MTLLILAVAAGGAALLASRGKGPAPVTAADAAAATAAAQREQSKKKKDPGADLKAGLGAATAVGGTAAAVGGVSAGLVTAGVVGVAAGAAGGFLLGQEAAKALGWSSGRDQGAGVTLAGVGAVAGASAVSGATVGATLGVGAVVVGAVYAANELFDSGGKAAAREKSARLYAGPGSIPDSAEINEYQFVTRYLNWMSGDWGTFHDANGHLRIGIEQGAVDGQDLGGGLVRINGHTFDYRAGNTSKAPRHTTASTALAQSNFMTPAQWALVKASSAQPSAPAATAATAAAAPSSPAPAPSLNLNHQPPTTAPVKAAPTTVSLSLFKLGAPK